MLARGGLLRSTALLLAEETRDEGCRKLFVARRNAARDERHPPSLGSLSFFPRADTRAPYLGSGWQVNFIFGLLLITSSSIANSFGLNLMKVSPRRTRRIERGGRGVKRDGRESADRRNFGAGTWWWVQYDHVSLRGGGGRGGGESRRGDRAEAGLGS